MEKNYIFKTKDGSFEVSLRGGSGAIRMGLMQKQGKVISVQGGAMVTTIITNIEDSADLEKQILC